MATHEKTPIYHEETDDILGYVTHDGVSFLATTIFGYVISRTSTAQEAESILRDQGATYLEGVWQYYDKSDRDWFPCVIYKAYEQKVIVNRTTELGYVDPEVYKQVIIENPTENTLVKAS